MRTLFVVVRGLPALTARRDLDLRSRIALGLLTATQLPLVVAIVEIGIRSGRLSLETGDSLVGAGMISVLLFPMVALFLHGRTAPRNDDLAESNPENKTADDDPNQPVRPNVADPGAAAYRGGMSAFPDS